MTGVRIPIRLRARVLARDADRCAFCRCAESLMGVTFEIDHVTPRGAGGAKVLANLSRRVGKGRAQSRGLRASSPGVIFFEFFEGGEGEARKRGKNVFADLGGLCAKTRIWSSLPAPRPGGLVLTPRGAPPRAPSPR